MIEAYKIFSPLQWDAVEKAPFSRMFITRDFIDGVPQTLPAAVYKDGKWGFIEQSGRILIEPKFDTLHWKRRGHTDWMEDTEAHRIETITLLGKEAVLVTIPMYLPAKREGRWYCVQVGTDGKIVDTSS